MANKQQPKKKGSDDGTIPSVDSLLSDGYRACYGDTCSVAGLNNSINPMDTLTFDINSLIPYSDVNWDCIEGLDSIHKSTLQAYVSLVKQLAERVDKLDERINQQEQATIDVANSQADRIEKDIDGIDQRIKGQLESLGFGLVNNYYTNPNQCCWFVVYRQSSDGQLIPLLEQTSQRPVDRPSYGPFQSLNEATRVIDFFREPLLTGHSSQPLEESSYNPSLQGQIDQFLQGIRNEPESTQRQPFESGIQQAIGYDYGNTYPVDCYSPLRLIHDDQ